jgi:DNA replication protein DnaC
MNNNLIRSHALNNVPKLKVRDKITDLLRSCEICSKRASEEASSIDGACQKCSLAIVVYNRYQEANIPIDYWDLKMEKDFIGDPRLLTKYNEYVADLKKSYTEGTSICFASGHGRGKTFTATAILKKACRKGYTCLYADLSNIISVLTQASSEEKYLARKELILTDFLAIDEADIRFFNQSDASSDLFGRSFESIIRTRIQNKLPIILATNSPNFKESFHTLFKDSIGSLMNEVPIFFVFGEDVRTKKDTYKNLEDPDSKLKLHIRNLMVLNDADSLLLKMKNKLPTTFNTQLLDGPMIRIFSNGRQKDIPFIPEIDNLLAETRHTRTILLEDTMYQITLNKLDNTLLFKKSSVQ